ncbi:hypothetical protein C6495_10440 [Candidatus Poribacteria bacterium]|nr:MAG: hypothetical protein C6495_10440 [Candidatus Poribacteria bacterium]
MRNGRIEKSAIWAQANPNYAEGQSGVAILDGVVGHALHDTEVIAEVEVVHGFTKKAKKVETGSVWTDSTPSFILCPPQVTDVSPYEQ